MSDDEDQKEKAPEYTGPYISKTIEYYGSPGKDIELFGSWNKFAGGDELQYKGQNIYAVDCKLPLGNYVYRFLIDGDDWETNDDLQKTVKDGVEYNTISVRENGDESDKDSSDEDEEQEEENDNGDENDKTLVYDEQTGSFVVGKKRRGRPSIEIELPSSFVGNDKEEDKNKLTSVNEKSPKKNDETKKKRKRARKRRRMRGFGNQQNIDISALLKQKEEEWARMVFVQQLRQQQEHNDEIQRVKTLWKQERQVRVEMHKKVIQHKKKLEQELTEVKGEVDKLKKLIEIGNKGDKSLSEELEKQIKSLTKQLEDERQKSRDLETKILNVNKEKVENEKSTLSKSSEYEQEIKNYTNQISSLEQEIKSLKSNNDVLQSNLKNIKSGNEELRGLETQRYQDLQKNWETEKKDLLVYKEDNKKLKQQINELQSSVNQLKLDKGTLEQQYSNEKNNNSNLDEKCKKLEKQILDLSDTTKKSDEIKVAVQKEREILETDKKILNEKLENLNKQFEQQKVDFEKELKKVQEKAKQDLESVSNKSNKETGEKLQKLRDELSGKDESIRKLKESVGKLEASNKEEGSKNESLNKQLESSKKENSELTDKFNNTSNELNETKSKLNSTSEELNKLKTDKESSDKNYTLKIETLEKELNSTKQSTSEQSKELEDKISNLETNVDNLKKDINSKAEENSKLTETLNNKSQEIESLNSNLSNAKGEIDTLKKNIDKERESNSNSIKEKDSKILELTNNISSISKEKNDKIHGLEDDLNKLQTELNNKLKEFSNSQTTIKKLKSEIESNNETFDKQKKQYLQQIETHNKKDEKIMKSCKLLSEKFSGFRSEMDDIKNKKILQLEKMNEFFPNFKELLTKAFGFHQNLIDGLMEKYKKELSARRKYFNELQDLRGNIRVFCRVRPLLKFELEKGYKGCMKFPEDGMLIVRDEQNNDHKFEFSQVYKPGTTQEQVSQDTTEYIQSVMDGYNVSIFAYGQTGSGKTYTMEGEKKDPGVNLRALRQLFNLAQERSGMIDYKIKVAIYEIYIEKIKDLIAGLNIRKGKVTEKKNQKKQDIKIRHLPDDTVEVQGINWVTVNSDADVIALNNCAKKNRSAGVTDMNAHSSRSHMILCVKVKGVNLVANIDYFGSLYLVDLAGSERVKKSGATGQAMKEAQAINKSLSALGDVMQALQNKTKYIPYRNSKLTEIMTNSLGGTAKTIMFINCCPTGEHAFETISSLKFATRVGKVELGQVKQNKVKKKKKKSKN